MRRILTYGCALIVALALLVSGCGGAGNSQDPAGSRAGSSNVGQSGPSGQDGSSGSGGQGNSGDSGDSASSDDLDIDFDANADVDFDVIMDEWFFSLYTVASRFNKIEYRMSASDEDGFGLVRMEWVTPGEFDGQTVERLHVFAADDSAEDDDTMDIEFWFAPDGTMVAFRSLTDPDEELATDEFSLNLIQFATLVPLAPFNMGRMLLAEENPFADVEDLEVTIPRILSKQLATETVLGRQVPVVFVTVEFEDDGSTDRATARVANIAGLPMLLEMTGHDGNSDSVMYVTPIVLDLR